MYTLFDVLSDQHSKYVYTPDAHLTSIFWHTH
jgi:hypothetical protein